MISLDHLAIIVSNDHESAALGINFEIDALCGALADSEAPLTCALKRHKVRYGWALFVAKIMVNLLPRNLSNRMVVTLFV